ncbi:MAG: PH domain-containing protein [Candidatus Longimicrobiales bacterium M2_2A_002]
MNLEPLPTELRPTPALMKYYVLSSLLAGPFFFFPLIPLFARYRSLRYRVDEEGISMRWGILFRREVSLNYARIQDIHLSSNVLERWLGLGKIQVQTASGSAGAEMTVEGLPDLDAMRDFLYDRMRGARGEGGMGAETAGSGGATGAGSGGAVPAADAGAPRSTPGDELTDTLRAVAAELRAIRESVEERRSDA